MNPLHSNIKFTLEVEKNGMLPFLDVLVCRKQDGSLGHGVYRKRTHPDLYLNARSSHHAAQKTTVLSTLVYRDRAIADKASIPGELQHLWDVFRANGYAKCQIQCTVSLLDLGKLYLGNG